MTNLTNDAKPVEPERIVNVENGRVYERECVILIGEGGARIAVPRAKIARLLVHIHAASEK